MPQTIVRAGESIIYTGQSIVDKVAAAGVTAVAMAMAIRQPEAVVGIVGDYATAAVVLEMAGILTSDQTKEVKNRVITAAIGELSSSSLFSLKERAKVSRT